MVGKLKKRASRFIRRSAGVDSLKRDFAKQREMLERCESMIADATRADAEADIATTLGMMRGKDESSVEVAERLFKGLPSATGYLRQIQLLQTILLAYLDKVCTANSIRYWLDSSTLAGAIMRGGFIPWERDAAVSMVRDDFNRLKTVLADKHDGFYLHELYSHSASGSVNHTCQLKFQGADEIGCPVCLNIFLYDYCEAGEKASAGRARDRIKAEHAREAADLASLLLKSEHLPEFENEFQSRMAELFNRHFEHYVEACCVSLLEQRKGLIYALDNRVLDASVDGVYESYEEVFPLVTVSFEGMLLQGPQSATAQARKPSIDAVSLAEGLRTQHFIESELEAHRSAIDKIFDHYNGLLDRIAQVEAQISAGSGPDASVVESPVALPCLFDAGTCDRLANPYPMSEADHAEHTAYLQVMKRVDKLGVDVLSPVDFKGSCERIEAVVPKSESSNDPGRLEFTGSVASELNSMLAIPEAKIVAVSVDELLLDEPIVMPSGVALYGNGVRLAKKAQSIEAAIVLKEVHDVVVEGFVIDGVANFGIAVYDCESFILERNTICNMACKGISIIGECSKFRITSNEIINNVDGGLFVDGEIENGVIERNEIAHSTTAQNFSAGILIGARDVADLDKPYDETKEPPLDKRLAAPHDILIANNVIHDHFAQGIYVFGGYRLLVTRNQVFGNQREGICLDYGAIACIVMENRFEANGGRAPEHLNEKVPGVSLDNAAYNVVWGNIIEHNSGSGVKLVRSSCRNTIAHNKIAHNNLGSNAVHHFFGITIGGTLVPDFEGQVDLDLAPSFDNVVAHNLIIGCHFAGIHVDGGCYKNTCFGNEVIAPELWAMECVSKKENHFFRNVSLAPDRIV